MKKARSVCNSITPLYVMKKMRAMHNSIASLYIVDKVKICATVENFIL